MTLFHSLSGNWGQSSALTIDDLINLGSLEKFSRAVWVCLRDAEMTDTRIGLLASIHGHKSVLTFRLFWLSSASLSAPPSATPEAIGCSLLFPEVFPGKAAPPRLAAPSLYRS